MSTIEVRPLSEQHWPRICEVMALAFGEAVDQAVADRERTTFEFDRSLGAFAGDTLVGHANALSFQLTVPGGVVPMAGVSGVGVVPTERRRGALSGLMRRQLADVHERAEPVATLWASEPVIYGRFGYGIASWQLTLEVPRAHRRLGPVPGLEAVTLSLVEPAAAADRVAAVHNEVAAVTPGLFPWDARWRERMVEDLPSQREGRSPLRCVLATRDGTTTGFALWRTKASWDAGGPAGSVAVDHLQASDLASYAALAGLVADQDLMARARIGRRPVDDPLLYLLADPRRSTPRIHDGLLVRLVDVPAALGARHYACPVDVVLEVTDELCPWNAGRYHLGGDRTGASCAPTREAPDLTLDVRTLGAAYLGGNPLAGLGRAGQVVEHRPGVLGPVSAAFGWDRAPYCDTGF